MMWKKLALALSLTVATAAGIWTYASTCGCPVCDCGESCPCGSH